MAQPIFRHTDPGAPVSDFTVGSMCNIFDACLVNGYGSKAPLGWSIKFSATGKRVYKMNYGTGFELGIDETGLTYAAKARGAESFSDINTPVGPFPTVAQSANGLYWYKSSNSAGPRAWTLVGDRKRFFFYVHHSGGTTVIAHFFGDIVSYRPGGDPFCCMIFGGRGGLDLTYDSDYFQSVTNVTGTCSNHFIARMYTGLGGSLNCGKYCDSARGNMGGGSIPFPDPVSGSLHLSRLWVNEPSPTSAPRGYIPGLWAPLHTYQSLDVAGVPSGSIFSGSDGLSSRTFEIKTHGSYNTSGASCFELSDWPESA